MHFFVWKSSLVIREYHVSLYIQKSRHDIRKFCSSNFNIYFLNCESWFRYPTLHDIFTKKKHVMAKDLSSWLSHCNEYIIKIRHTECNVCKSGMFIKQSKVIPVNWNVSRLLLIYRLTDRDREVNRANQLFSVVRWLCWSFFVQWSSTTFITSVLQSH